MGLSTIFSISRCFNTAIFFTSTPVVNFIVTYLKYLLTYVKFNSEVHRVNINTKQFDNMHSVGHKHSWGVYVYGWSSPQ